MKTKMMAWQKMLFTLALTAMLAGCQKSGPAPAATVPPKIGSGGAATANATEVIKPTLAVETPAVTEMTAQQPTTAPDATMPPAPTLAPDEIDALLELRGVRILLVVDREGDGARELAAEIDEAGNMRIVNTSTGAEANLPDEMYVGMTAVQHEVRVIDGQAYRQDGETNDWLPAPGLEDYLERSLRSSEGPGLWMRLLSEKHEARGQEPTGGMQAERFHLSGEVDENAEIVGDIWVASPGGALVRAEIEIPGHLFAYSGAGVHYPVVIRLEVTPAAVDAVKVP